MAERLSEVWSERTVGEVVAEDYRRAAIFKAFGIDFCCGGGRSVRSACEQAGAEYEAVARALAGTTASEDDVGVADPASWELERVVRHIIEEHHGYVRASVPVLREFTMKLARVHGDRHGELHEIRELVGDLTAELERHMKEVEEVLFPRIMALKSQARGSGGASVRAATIPLEDDHARAGDLLRRIRSLSEDYTPPEDACTTYRATYAKLAEFEEDLHRHVHLENNVLFPRAAAAEAALAATGPNE